MAGVQTTDIHVADIQITIECMITLVIMIDDLQITDYTQDEVFWVQIPLGALFEGPSLPLFV